LIFRGKAGDICQREDVESLSIALLVRGMLPSFIISSEGLDDALNVLLQSNYAQKRDGVVFPSPELKALFDIRKLSLPFPPRAVRQVKRLLLCSFLIDAVTCGFLLSGAYASAAPLIAISILMKITCIWRLVGLGGYS